MNPLPSFIFGVPDVRRVEWGPSWGDGWLVGINIAWSHVELSSRIFDPLRGHRRQPLHVLVYWVSSTLAGKRV